MATLNLGRLKPVFRSGWNNSTAYNVDDIVVRNNQSYISIQAGTNQDPATATAYWTLIAAKGTDGTDVGTTITTQGDILYRDGSGLQRLAKPASDMYLKNTSGGVVSWSAVSSPIKKSYIKQFKGGQSISGFSASSPAEVSNYNLIITPTSTSSVFLATYNISIGSNADHTFMQAVAKTDGGSYIKLGRGKSSFENSNTYFDFGSFYGFSDGNHVKTAGHQFYYAPATTTNIVFALYCGQHSGTAYFGRSTQNTTDDYTALGMSLRVDEYASSSDLAYSEYTSG